MLLKNWSKRTLEPAFLYAWNSWDDIILCQITSQQTKDIFAVPLTNHDFTSGSLPVDSYIRSTRIFTADKTIIIRKTGTVKPNIVNDVIKNIISLIQ